MALSTGATATVLPFSTPQEPQTTMAVSGVTLAHPVSGLGIKEEAAQAAATRHGAKPEKK